jgi:hypothetical protein
MRVTTSQLRQIVINPSRYAVRARVPQDPNRRHAVSPQRSWMDSAWRDYFASGRDPDVLWATFDQKVKSKDVTRQRAALADGGRRMLDQFLEWDADEIQSPQLWKPPTLDVEWQGHTLALKRDAIYLTDSGFAVRLFWTDHALTVLHPDAALMAAGVLAYSDTELGLWRVERIEVWQLRGASRRIWERADLDLEMPTLRARLDHVAAMVEQ